MHTNKTRKIKRVYTNDDYKSNDGMLTSVWGPGMWHYLHTMSFNYPITPTSSEKKHYRDFIIQLKYVLPCGKCRKNLRKNLKELPIKMKHMKNRDTFSRYVFELHEHINTMLGKHSGLSFEEVRERYEHFRSRCSQPYSIRKNNMNNKTKKVRFANKLEQGCTTPLYGSKSKCVLHIVPDETKCETLNIDKKCVKDRVPTPAPI